MPAGTPAPVAAAPSPPTRPPAIIDAPSSSHVNAPLTSAVSSAVSSRIVAVHPSMFGSSLVWFMAIRAECHPRRSARFWAIHSDSSRLESDLAGDRRRELADVVRAEDLAELVRRESHAEIDFDLAHDRDHRERIHVDVAKSGRIAQRWAVDRGAGRDRLAHDIRD